MDLATTLLVLAVVAAVTAVVALIVILSGPHPGESIDISPLLDAHQRRRSISDTEPTLKALRRDTVGRVRTRDEDTGVRKAVRFGRRVEPALLISKRGAGMPEAVGLVCVVGLIAACIFIAIDELATLPAPTMASAPSTLTVEGDATSLPWTGRAHVVADGVTGRRFLVVSTHDGNVAPIVELVPQATPARGPE